MRICIRLCCFVSDYNNGNGSEEWDLKQSLEWILDKYLGIFCESVFNQGGIRTLDGVFCVMFIVIFNI